MAKSEVEEVTQKTLENGGILAKVYFDMQSEKQEDLQPLMTDLINNRLLKTPGVVYCYGTIEEPIKVQESYSTSAVLTVLFKDLWSLLNVAFNFAPAGIEIMKPEKEYRLKPGELESIALNVAQISVGYSQYILSRVLKEEDYGKILAEIKSREDLGRKFLEKRDK